MVLNIDYFQKQLEEEKTKIEGELGTVATRNPDAPADWNVSYPDMNASPSAPDEIADQEEEYENRVSIEAGLEIRLREINDAIERIKHGGFGICKEKGEPISEERLRANPAANTCVEHADK
ncbi:MAG: TraR/DksA family transcriptional regulator [Patescibacteria group bacterium]